MSTGDTCQIDDFLLRREEIRHGVTRSQSTSLEAVLGQGDGGCDGSSILSPKTARESLHPVCSERGRSPGGRLRRLVADSLGQDVDQAEDVGMDAAKGLKNQGKKLVGGVDVLLVFLCLLLGLPIRRESWSLGSLGDQMS